MRDAHDRVVTVVGGGLAGCEAAWQLARLGHRVVLHEMRPVRQTAAHRTDRLAELVCSNTFKSTEPVNAHGALKDEMRELGSMVLECADATRVPAGSALAVDRDAFAEAVTQRISTEPNIQLVRDEVTALPSSPAIIATGPLTSDALAEAIRTRVGVESLSFYDAIAPVISIDSIDETQAFRASRYGKETMEGVGNEARDRGSEGAYINCPLDADQYRAFVDALVSADRHRGHAFDEVPYFEGCMPAEEMAARGPETLRFGPLKPVGLRDPRTGRVPHAVVQLRREDRAGRMWNVVGFQTRLRIPEQQRVFRMIPALREAEFLRYGSVHRNSYVNSPAVLTAALSLRDDSMTMLAGQITGVEGYTESTATGLLAGINMSRQLAGLEAVVPSPCTMLGGLYRYLREADPRHFQPMNANFGLVDDLVTPGRDKRLRRERLASRGVAEIRAWRDALAGIPQEWSSGAPT